MNENAITILRAIPAYTKAKRHPPTIRELAAETGVSPTTVVYHLQNLQKWGYVDWNPHLPRTLRALPGWTRVNLSRGTPHPNKEAPGEDAAHARPARDLAVAATDNGGGASD